MSIESNCRRLCITNDREALAEELAKRMWLCRRDRDIEPDKWEDAPSYWQMVMREFAAQTIDMLSHG